MQTTNQIGSLINQLKKSVLGEAIPIVAAKIGTAGFAFLLSAMLTNIMGAASYGEYIYLITWITFLAILGVLGLNRLAVRFIPTFIAGKDDELRATFSRYLFLCGSLTTIAVSFILLLLIRQGIVSSLSPIEPQISLLLIAILILNVASRIIGGVVEGKKRVLISKLLVESALPLVMSLTVAAIWFFELSDRITRDWLLWLYMLTLLGATAILIFVSQAGGKVEPRERPQRSSNLNIGSLFRDWTGITLSFTLIANIHVVMNQADIFMLGIFDDASSVAVYSIVRKISTFQLFVLIGFNSYLAPRVAEMLNLEKFVALQKLVKSITIYSSILTLAVGLGIFLFRFQIFSLFGEGFAIGSLPLIFLLIAQFINVLTGPVEQLLHMSGHHTTALKCGVFSSVLNLILNFLWIPSYGLLGASIASGISIVINNLIMLYFVNRYLPIKSGIFYFLNPMRPV